METPAGPLEEQFRALAAAGRLPPLVRLARINVAHGLTFNVHGVPDPLQRALWRVLAALPAPSPQRPWVALCQPRNRRCRLGVASASWRLPGCCVEPVRVAGLLGRVVVASGGGQNAVLAVLARCRRWSGRSAQFGLAPDSLT